MAYQILFSGGVINQTSTGYEFLYSFGVVNDNAAAAPPTGFVGGLSLMGVGK